MSPVVFESLLFLKVNSKYWTLVEVLEALARGRSNIVFGRFEEDVHHLNFNV